MSLPTTPDQNPSKERLRLWLRLLRTTRRVEAEIRERLRTQFATTLPRFDVLAALARNPGGLKMNELSERLKVSNGNITGIITRLVDDGSVVRIAIEGDRRATRVKLTANGQALFEQLAVAHEQWIDELFAELPTDTAHELIDLLARLPADSQNTKKGDQA